MASWRLSTKDSRDSAGAIPRPKSKRGIAAGLGRPLAFRSSLQPAGRLGGPGARPAATAPGSARAARRRRAQSTRKARLAPGACVAPELRLRKRTAPTAWRAAWNPPLVWVGDRRFSNSGSNRRGHLAVFIVFFFKSCARRALTRLAKFLFFGKPDNAWGGLGGGKTLGKARGCHGQTIPILAEGHPPSRLTLLFPCAEDAKRGAGSPCCALRIAPKKR